MLWFPFVMLTLLSGVLTFIDRLDMVSVNLEDESSTLLKLIGISDVSAKLHPQSDERPHSWCLLSILSSEKARARRRIMRNNISTINLPSPHHQHAQCKSALGLPLGLRNSSVRVTGPHLRGYFNSVTISNHFTRNSYQIEGAITQDGRGPSIWDEFCDKPSKIADGSSGATACDSYHHVAEDIALLTSTGAKAYRFSISWSRIVPRGGRNDPVNQVGIDHYVKFVNALLAAGIEPMVTLFHWDLPQTLYERYGGFLNQDEFVRDFENYADIMFKALAGKVKYWITFNEPYCSAILGHNLGVFAPGRTSDRTKSDVGDSSTEPWIVAHSILIAHGTAAKLYREKYQATHGGAIAITLNGDWAEPYDSTSALDQEACQRRVEFYTGWFADPIYLGDYPASMRAQLGSRLPQFSEAERALVRNSNDFYGMNHYTTNYIRHRTTPASALDYEGNMDVLAHNSAGKEIGPETEGTWLRPCASGFRKLLRWISERYGRPVIYVTENGTSIKGESALAEKGEMDKVLDDEFRVRFYTDYIDAMAQARAQDAVDVRGYMAWSLLDNFEWADGYKTRFGCVFVDYEHGQKRIPKKSAKEMKKIFERYIEKS
ncbi:hypothetical protein R6Q59_009919 [Mikania micrantha]